MTNKTKEWRNGLRPWLRKMPRWVIFIILILLLPIHYLLYVSKAILKTSVEVVVDHIEILKTVWHDG